MLDAFRNSSIVDGEAGGITQHIGAFVVPLAGGQQITFLDTPGHAAFSAMRERGSLCTDVVVLVVAADDGVMPQTEESIKFAAAAGVPMVVAINKCDKETIDISRTKQALLDAGVELEDAGGDIQSVEVSALKRMNLDKLQEAIMIAAEFQDLRAEDCGIAEGVIIEAQTELGKGPVATMLVRRGELKTGAVVVAGKALCRVRSLQDGTSARMKAAGPSVPVEITGWDTMPMVGDVVIEVPSEQRAREVVDYRQSLDDDVLMSGATKGRASEEREMESLRRDAASEVSELNLRFRATKTEMRKVMVAGANAALETGRPEYAVMIKADVVGSEEAICAVLQSMARPEVDLTIVSSGVGEVTPVDIERAEIANATIFQFNLPRNKTAEDMCDNANVKLSGYKVIYELMEEVEEQLKLLVPKQLVVVGKAVVKQLFTLTGARKAVVAGSSVTSGSVTVGLSARCLRDGEIVWDGSIAASAKSRHSLPCCESASARFMLTCTPLMTCIACEGLATVERSSDLCG